MSKGFSIVICSYNPDDYVFQRLIEALSLLDSPQNFPIEYIIIDNNSTVPINSKPVIDTFLKKGINRKCVVELKSGLTEARIRGFEESRYEWVIFFDDDNEPNQEYLTNLHNAITSYPQVMCWGPAEIEVELLNIAKNEWVQKKKLLFQERAWGETHFDIAPIWQSCFPYGTGLVVHRSVMEEYKVRIKNGQYSLSDRKGKSLSSGGDIQIVLTSTSMGLPAGTIHGLKINHLIIERKAKLEYLERQVYGTSSSYIAAHKQVTPNLNIDDYLLTDHETFKLFISFLKCHLFRTGLKDFRLQLASFFGGLNARYVYHQVSNKPVLIRFYETLINA